MEIKRYKNKVSIEIDNSEIGKITWVERGNDLLVDHTYVNPDFRGGGYAQMLVDEVVAYAREEGKMIVPICPYVVKVLNRDAKYSDILKNE